MVHRSRSEKAEELFNVWSSCREERQKWERMHKSSDFENPEYRNLFNDELTAENNYLAFNPQSKAASTEEYREKKHEATRLGFFRD